MHIDRIIPSVTTRSDPVTRTGHRNPVWEALVHGLEIEFGTGVSRALAQRFLDAEECDFLWQARVGERWLGRYECAFDDGHDSDCDEDGGRVELDRIAVLGTGPGTTGQAGSAQAWYVATLIVDGEGDPHGVIGHRAYADRIEAERAWVRAG
ncbi:hypothetical protein [Novosphingobium kaempferiae]|uniref:hypothetical protein n=1 Tax=Novosphingobium kaempferiae TaxID=2896849 RepID=UPI001E536E40|nr:hypothetical protein [Novosphingobium kaempferiae]